MKLDLEGIYSIMKIEWYWLTFKHIFMVLAIKILFEKEENEFSLKLQFLGLQLMKNALNQK